MAERAAGNELFPQENGGHSRSQLFAAGSDMGSMKVDFLVIGGGPAGQKAAIQASKLGKRVLLVEKFKSVGGVSVHTGTIPSKTMREAVLYLSGWRQRGFYGRSYRLKKNLKMADLVERLDITIQHEVDVIRDQLVRNGVDLRAGIASFLGPKTIQITANDGTVQKVEADSILIATGTKPHRASDIPFDGRRILDSDEVLRMPSLPRSMCIVGAGVIGLEYASIFSSLDIKVSMIDSRNRMLDFLDEEITNDLQFHLRDRGVSIRLGESIESARVADGRVHLRLKSGREMFSDVVLFAAGRVGNTSILQLENAGLCVDKRGRIQVNEFYQTEQSHIYAAGDVIGFPSLASTSMEQGRIAACNAFSQSAPDAPEHFPFGIYSVPEISMIGKTEQALREIGVPFEVGTARFRETARGQILGVEKGVLKMLFSLEDRRVLGVHILGEGATELIHIGQAVLHHGGTLDYFVDSVFNFPTLAEAYKIAALDAYNRMPKRSRIRTQNKTAA